MKWALVTGAAKRLGRACVLELAQAGWGVVVHHRGSPQEAQEAADEARSLGAPAATLAADLADEQACADLVARAQAAAGEQLGAIVNCAALFEHDVIETISAEAFARQMQVNTLAPCLIARAYAASLGDSAGSDAAPGAIVNFLDFKLANPYPDHFSYTLSKYALAGATELLARGLAPRVRVNAVAPGYVLPAPGQSDEAYQRLHDDTPLEYGPTPEDVASAARFLIESPAITGQTIYVDAGRRFVSHTRDMAFM